VNATPLRIGFAAVVRDAFKGDAAAVTTAALTALERAQAPQGYVLVDAPSMVTDAATATRVGDWAQGQQLNFLLVLHATFATGDLLAPLLQAVPRTGIWAVPERLGLPLRRRGVTPDMRPLPLNSLCGLNMSMSLLDHPSLSTARSVKWFWGAPDEPRFWRRWETTVRALRGLQRLEHARVLQIGGTAPAFYRLEERPTLEHVRVDSLPLHALFDAMASIDASAVAARADTWQRSEPLVGATLEQLAVAARTELALAALAQGGDYQALALRCWPEFAEHCDAMACAAVGAMADRSVPTACEGDVMGALSMLALQGVADAPSALLDLSDLDADGDRVMLWHCGNAPTALAAAPGARLTTHFNRDGTGVVRDMRLAPGPASGFRLLAGGQASMIMTGDIADATDSAPHDDVDGVRAWWGNLAWDGTPLSAYDAVSQVLDERLPHHLALAAGAHGEALHELSVWLGADVLPARPARDALQRPRVRTPAAAWLDGSG